MTIFPHRSARRSVSELCTVSVHALVISRSYVDTPSELSLRVEGLTTDGFGVLHRVCSDWFLDRNHVGVVSILADARLGSILKLSSPSCSLEPHKRPDAVCLGYYNPDYAVVPPADLAPVLLDRLYDHLDDHVDEEEVFDAVTINEDWMDSPVTREDLLQTIADSWHGTRWFRKLRFQDAKERQMSNPGYLNFKAKVCVNGRDESVLGHLQGMCERVEVELRRAVELHPEWFNLSPNGPSVYESMQAGTPGEAPSILGAPIEVLPSQCTTIDDLPIHFGPAEVYAFVTDSEAPEGWVVPPVFNLGCFADFSILFSFSFQNTSPFLVRFAPDSPPTYVATAIEDLVKAYVFPEAIAMNDFMEMQSDLCWGTCLYSHFEFDLRWGGFASVSERVKAVMEGNGNTFAVLSYPMDGFDAEMPVTLSAICEAAEACLGQDAGFLLSCSLNVVAGRTARLSLFCRLPEDEEHVNVG